MAPFLGLLLLSLSLFSRTVASIASPRSVGSDLTIVAHNDLYANQTSRRLGALALSTPYTNAAALSKCVELGSILFNPDAAGQSLQFLGYLDYGKAQDNVGLYWINGKTGPYCRAITTTGTQALYSCDAQLPALCSNMGADDTRQIAVTSGNATFVGRRRPRDSSFRFLGIKYATSARFSHSTYLPPTPGSNISALEYGPSCVQSGCGTSAAPSCSEDCLHLNIWTPYLPNTQNTTGTKKAVMVWIHGGGFTGGTGSDTTFDGSALASRGDVVAVTINYRLSTLGFLALENTTVTGNYGLQDQNRALDWLRAHVEDFGGDKDKITIFGQSAGGASVRALLASPQSRDKVAGAILMSSPAGLGYASTYAEYYSITQASDQTKALLGEIGCTQTGEELLACLQAANPRELIGFRNTTQSWAGTIARFPVVDGTFLTSSSLPLGPSAPKLRANVMSGLMHDDGSAFSAFSTSTNLLEALTSQGFPASTIVSSNTFPLANGTNSTLAIFNVTSRVSTDGLFRCLGQSTAQTAATNGVFKSVYAYEFDRAYQIAEWSPNPPACEAPVTPGHPFGDPEAPFYKCHSGELYAVFGTTISQGRRVRDQNDIPFSQYVVDTWSAFARTGIPTPDPSFLAVREFANTTKIIQAGGAWEPVGAADAKNLHVLDVRPGSEVWREGEQCKVLGQGLDYYNH